MEGLMPDLSSLGVQGSRGQSVSRGEASGSEMPLMLPQHDELEKVTQKISEVEEALAGNRTYLGITDTCLLVKELHSLRKKEEQIRDLQLLLLRSMGPKLALAGSNFGVPHQLVGAGVGGGIPAGHAVPQAATGSVRPTAVLGAPVGTAPLVPQPHQTGSSSSSSSSSSSNVATDPNAIGVGEDANSSCDITGGVDADGEGRNKRRRTSAAVSAPAATVTPHADEDIDSGRREDSPIEGSLSPGPSAFSGQSPERREEYEDGGEGGDRNTSGELDAPGAAAGREGTPSCRSGSLPMHADLVIGADGRQSKRAGEVWRVMPCREMGCTKRPSFGLPGDAKASYCGAHKLKGMMLVNRRRRCLHEGCSRQPLYGTDTDRVPLACGAHKAPEHVNVTHRRCAQPSCTTQPVYGDAPVTNGERFCPEFCAVHKRPGMVSQKRTRCSTNRCYRRAAYGMLGGEIKVCAEHKLEGMVKITQLQGPRGPPSSYDSLAVTPAGAQQSQSKDSAATVESYSSNSQHDGNIESNTPRSGEATRSIQTQPPSPLQQQQQQPPSISGATSGTEAESQFRHGGSSSFTTGASSVGVAHATYTGGGSVSGPAGQVGSGKRINVGREGGGNENEEQRSLGAGSNYDARRESMSGVSGGSGTSGRLPPSPQLQQQQQRHHTLHRESLLALPPPPHGPLPLPIPDHQSGRQGRLSSTVGVGGVSGSGEGCDDLPSSHHHGHFQRQQQQHMEQHYRSQHLQQQLSQQPQQQQQHLQQQQLPPLTAAAHGGPPPYPQTIPVHQIDHQLVVYPSAMPGVISHPVALFSHASGSSIVRGDQLGGMGFRDPS